MPSRPGTRRSTGRPTSPSCAERVGSLRAPRQLLAPRRDPRPGLIVGDEVVDLGAAGLPATIVELLALGPAALAQAGAAATGGAARHALAEVRRHAPVPQPPAILAIGMNYRAHVAEMGREPPEWQYWFNKQRTSVTGPGDPIVLPTVSDMVDYEGELAMVIGRRCQHVPGRPRLRGGGRLHRDQRRERPRLAVADADLHDGQVLRHPRSLRTRAGDAATSWATPSRWPFGPGSTTSCARTPARPT